MPVADTGRNTALDSLGTAITHLGLLDRTKTELTGGSPAYARKAITWNAAASGQKTGPNANLSFDAPPGAVYFVSGHSALTAGTQHMYWPAGNQPVKMAGVLASSDVITSYAHGLVANDEVIVYDSFASIPAGLTDETIYYVISTGLTTDAFEVSATLGGAAVNVTANGMFSFQKIIPESFGLQGLFNINSGAYTIDGRIV
jgi:hypothetical protein